MCVLLSFFVLLPSLPAFSAQAEHKSGTDDSYIGSIAVGEQNGVEVKGFLAQRGVPLRDGKLKENESLFLINSHTGEEIPIQTKVLETFESGFVSWLLVSFVCDLAPNENLHFKLYRGDGTNPQKTPLSSLSDDGKITVNNGKFIATFDGMGIENIKLGKAKVFSEEGVGSTYVEKNITYGITNPKLEIIDNGEVYSKIKLSADYGEGAMRIEKTYTFSAMADTIECTTLYVSSNGTYRDSRNWGYDTVNSMYDTFALSDSVWQTSYQPSAVASGDGIKSVSYAHAYNSYDNISFSVVSRDVEKFRSALSRETSNGFLFRGSTLIYTPLIYDSSYSWQDGASKSTHASIVVSRGNNDNCESLCRTLCNPPSVRADTQMFVDAGVIESDSVSAVAQAQIDEIKWTKDRRYGKFDAGAIPFYVNSTEEYMGADLSVRLGEVEYNVWLAAIASGDPELFDIVNESTEAWADIEIYQGTVKEARGYTRYRSGSGSDAAISHGYYVEGSSLYIAYLMTGNDYFKNQLYSVVDLQARLASVAANTDGNEMYYQGGWSNSRMGVKGDIRSYEIRFAFMLRAVYNAYKLFKDDKFLNLALNMNSLTASCQEEDGSWAQSYSSYGLEQNHSSLGVPAYKNYIMLYTLRAHCDLYNQTGNETAKGQILKFADYLISELGDNDWTYDPNNTEGKNKTGEDKSRGKAPIQEAMESEIFLTAFNATGDEKYFDALCRVLSNYVATMLPTGFSTQRYNHKDYLKGSINSVISGQNTTLMRIDSALCNLFSKHSDLAKKLGYDGLLAIYSDDAAMNNSVLYHEFQPIELGANLFESSDGRYLFVSNNSGYNSGKWDKNVKVHLSGSSSLWTEFKCEISNTFETVVSKDMAMFESIYSKELPIRITSFDSPVRAEVIRYDSNEIIFKVSSERGRVCIEVSDGEFDISDGNEFTITSEGGIEKTISIKRGTGQIANGKKLSLNLDFSDETNVFYDLINHWSNEEVMMLYGANIVCGVDECRFAPEENITLRHTLLLLTRAMGIDDDESVSFASDNGILLPSEASLLDSLATREQIINCTMRAMTHMRGEDMKESPIELISLYMPKHIDDDNDAVVADSEALTFEQTELYDNIVLPSEGVYGSNIQWSEGNEYLTPEGKITYPKADSGDAGAILTAIFSRGTATYEKQYSFVVKSASAFSYQSGSFSDSLISICEQKGDFDFEFSAVPNAGNVNWCIGLFDKNVVPQGYGEMALIVRFNPNGAIDAYNASAYESVEAFGYRANKKYNFKVTGSVDSKTYNVWVTDEDGNSAQIAAGYRFRSTANVTDNLGLMNSVVASGRGIISDLTIASANASTAPYGKLGAKEYFNITDSDVLLSGDIKYISTAPDIINNEGKFISTPLEDTNAYLIGQPVGLRLYDDIYDADPTSCLNILNARSLGIIRQGEDNLLRPLENCSRAEAACIAQRFYMLLKVKNLKWQ